ncbi:hypothetical protein GF376_02815 [Candidatus Peregrinibacteria bacterium]|nr:hypothetical protein [Candidatus Peregrinibacteria bacterium]
MDKKINSEAKLYENLKELGRKGEKLRYAALIPTSLGFLLVKNPRKSDQFFLDQIKNELNIAEKKYQEAQARYNQVRHSNIGSVDFPEEQLKFDLATYEFEKAISAYNASKSVIEKGRYHLPGGTPTKEESIEDPDQGIIREILEETQLRISNVSLITILSEYDQAKDSTIHHAIFLGKAGNPAEKESQPNSRNYLKITENSNVEHSFGFLRREPDFPMEDDRFYRQHVIEMHKMLYETDPDYLKEVGFDFNINSKEFGLVGILSGYYKDYINSVVYCPERRFLHWRDEQLAACTILGQQPNSNIGVFPKNFRLTHQTGARNDNSPTLRPPRKAKSRRPESLEQTGERIKDIDIEKILQEIDDKNASSAS